MTLLSVRDLCKDFGGLRSIVDLDLSIDEGELVGLVGPNGAGKTTLFNIITGFLRPTSGSVLWEGEEITHLRPDSIAKRGIVRTFQQTNLFSDLTVIENTIAGFHIKTEERLPILLLQAIFHIGDFRKKELETRSQAVEILDFLGLGNKSDVIASNLSHVDQKKSELAVALAAQPKLLLLDEPAAGMHPDEVQKLTGIIKNIQEQGITILLVEHNMRFVMSTVDRMIVLNYGSKIAMGTPAEIRHNEDVIKIYLGSEGKNA